MPKKYIYGSVMQQQRQKLFPNRRSQLRKAFASLQIEACRHDSLFWQQVWRGGLARHIGHSLRGLARLQGYNPVFKGLLPCHGIASQVSKIQL